MGPQNVGRDEKEDKKDDIVVDYNAPRTGLVPIRSYFQQHMGGIQGSAEDCIYFFGIIDILQQYDSVKKAEHFFKSFKYDPDSISSVEPTFYAERMKRFLQQSLQ
eukprot:TRINITY_DN44380_c0_g1_i1.p1 TRINITY_DN44380_c0_g1~~TRINITY_DN44380_c0_g1_i1.p1  ORF type:complete len:113 (-),score=31.77 TRINITY_DN44380_c0_g1_i1:318-632(-)